jgi:prolyl oligopeptidase
MEGFAATKNLLLLSLLEEVKSVNHCWRYLDKAWVDLGRRGEGGMNELKMWAVDADNSDALWVSLSGHLTPSSLYMLEAPLTDRPTDRGLCVDLPDTPLKVI